MVTRRGRRRLFLTQDARGHNLWQLTWTHARDISSGLSPQLLASTGVSAPAASAQSAAAPAAQESAASPGPAEPPSAVAAAAPVVAASPLAAALAAAEKQVLWDRPVGGLFEWKNAQRA